MKFKKLLVLSVLSLFGANAWAEVPEGIWTIPEPQGLEFMEFEEGTHAYLYNPGSKMFFYSGYNWNTRACLSGKAFEIWFVTSTETGAPENSYEFWDLFTNPDRGDVSGDHNVFTDDGGGSYCDHASQANYSWSVTKVGDAYRIQNVALVAAKPEFEGRYLGWDATAPDNIAYMLSPDAEGAFVDWKFVTAESFENFSYSDEYEAYLTACANYGAGNALAVSLKNAEELGINIEAWLAVYTNMESTTEELTKAKEEVDAVVAAKKSLKLLLDQAAEVNAPSAAAQEVYNNADATADELKNAYNSLNPMVSARAELKKALDEAVSVSFDAAEFKAVFDNGESTISQIQKATTDLAAQLVEWGKTHATVDNPSDMTSFIKNPNFDNASYTGWLGTEPNMVGSGSHGPANVAEKWNATFDTYQDITELPAGVYALGAKTSWRGNWSDMENGVGPAAKLYVTIGENEYSTPFNYIWACYNTEPLGGQTDFGTSAGENSEAHENEAGESVTYYSPNDPSAFRLYEEKGFYDTKVLFGLSDGSIRIGVKNPSLMGGADNWSCFDTFTLTYYGAGADAAKLYLDESLKNFSEVTIPEETVYTESYLTAYQAAYTGEKTADSFDAAAAIVNGISDAKKALDKNIELWKTYQKTCEDSFEKYCKDDASYNPEICLTVGDLADYVDGDTKYGDDGELPGYETTLNEHKLTNEELEAEIAYIDALCEQIDKEAKEGLKEGDDVTRFLKNADFEMCDVKTQTGEAPYWTVKKDVGNVTAGPLGQDNYNTMVNALGKMNYCFESWHSHDFDVYQEVNNVPEGVYVIEAQGYVRCENNGYTRPDEVADADIPIHLYLNNATDVFPSVYSELAADLGHEYTTVESWTTETQGGNLYPNSMGGAAQCFEWGMYKMQTYGLVKAGETMRIGVKGKMKTDDTENWWCIWDNFKLTFQGYNVEYVQPALDKAMASIDVSKPMGKNVYDTAKGLADKAAEAKATGDGKTMFQMLADVYDASAAIISSVQLFATLQDAIENETTGLQAAIYTSANDNAKAEAEALVGTITSGIENHDFSDDEVAGLLEQIANMKTKLAMPADWESATDQNPADFTGVIVNPDFVNPDTDLSYGDGWTNPGNPGNDDTQKSAQAMEFWQSKFDMYQDLQGLPKGTYIVQVDAWCRTGASQDAMNGYLENPDSTMAFVYAIGEDSLTFAAGVANLMKGAQTDDWYYDGIGEEILKVNGEDVSYYLPNSLVGGKAYMDPDIVTANEGVYTNKVIAKVGDDGKLRIGIKKDVDPANSWVVCDSWKLFYCGANSQLTPSGDLTLVETLEAQPARIEFYSVGGSRISKPGKGIAIMKKVMSDGSVKVQKVIIK